jgi:hypothetical protein
MPLQSSSTSLHVVSVDPTFVHAYSQPLSGFWSRSKKPAPQPAIAQAPAVQAAVAFAGAQRRPQAPQFATSVWSPDTLVSQPSLATPLLSIWPVSQIPIAQIPALQVPVALAGAQICPQPPQLTGSV